MVLIGTRIVAADRATFWAHFNNTETLQASIQDCEELIGTKKRGLKLCSNKKVGSVNATFKGTVTLEDVNPLQSYRINGKGKGGVAGFTKGAANVTLIEIEGGTELSYNANA